MDYWISVILRKWWALNQINIIYNTLFVWKFSCSTFCSDLSLSERKTEYGNIDVTKSHISAVHHHFSLPECLAERNNEIALFFVLIIVRWANMNIQWGLHDPAIDPSAFVSVRSHFFSLIYYIIFMILVPFNLFAFKLFGHCELTIQCADMILFSIQIAQFLMCDETESVQS